MKKVTGCINVRALGEHEFEFYVADDFSDKEIKKMVEEVCDYYIDYEVKEGYKEIVKTTTEYVKKEEE